MDVGGEDNFWDVSNVLSLFLFWEQNFFITNAYIYRRNFLNVYCTLKKEFSLKNVHYQNIFNMIVSYTK